MLPLSYARCPSAHVDPVPVPGDPEREVPTYSTRFSKALRAPPFTKTRTIILTCVEPSDLLLPADTSGCVLCALRAARAVANSGRSFLDEIFNPVTAKTDEAFAACRMRRTGRQQSRTRHNVAILSWRTQMLSTVLFSFIPLPGFILIGPF